MAVGPGGGSGVFIIDKSNAQGPFLSPVQEAKQTVFPFFCFPVLLDQGHLLLLSGQLHLLPGPLHPFPNLTVAVCEKPLIAKHLQIHEKRVALLCQAVRSRLFLIAAAESSKGSPKLLNFVLLPPLCQSLLKPGGQLLVSIRLRKQQLEQSCGPVKRRILVKGLGSLLSVPLWKDPGNVSRDFNGSHVFHHADPLISLPHIKMVHIFVNLYRLPDSLLHLGLIKPLPLS